MSSGQPNMAPCCAPGKRAVLGAPAGGRLGGGQRSMQRGVHAGCAPWEGTGGQHRQRQPASARTPRALLWQSAAKRDTSKRHLAEAARGAPGARVRRARRRLIRRQRRCDSSSAAWPWPAASCPSTSRCWARTTAARCAAATAHRARGIELARVPASYVCLVSRLQATSVDAITHQSAVSSSVSGKKCPTFGGSFDSRGG